MHTVTVLSSTVTTEGVLSSKDSPLRRREEAGESNKRKPFPPLSRKADKSQCLL